MKKFISLTLCLLLSLTLLCFSVYAESSPITKNAYVSISDENGELVLAYASVTLNDEDGDGNLTINDALIGAHKAHYKNGEEGFASEETAYGCSITKLWGFAGGSGYGYCVNDSSAMNCYDPIKEGDHIKAFVYTDTENFSDLYSFFDKTIVFAKAEDSVTLTLFANTYDENWNVVKTPVSGAEILIDGKASGIMTSENGIAEITVNSKKDFTVSAKSDSQTLVAPVCLVRLDRTTETTNMAITIAVISIVAVAAAAAIVVIIKKRKNHA